jgi:lauroyl/myristoyl acyltransferase
VISRLGQAPFWSSAVWKSAVWKSAAWHAVALLWRLAGHGLRAVPQSTAYAISGVVADRVYGNWPHGRRNIRANLRPVLGINSSLDSDDRSVLDYWGRRQLRRYAELLVDEARLPGRSRADCFDALITDEWPELDRALSDPRPLIFAVMHFGNWDVAGAAFAERGAESGAADPPLVLVESLGHPALDAVIHGQRRRLGMVPVSIEQAPLSALRALRRGGTVGILIDRPLTRLEPGVRSPGVDVTFCGAPCRLPDGFARLALSTNARIIPLATARIPGRDFRFTPLLDFDFTYASTGDRQADVQALTQSVLNVHQQWVRRYPDQWYQFRPFFNDERVETQPQPRKHAAKSGTVAQGTGG